MRGIRFVQVPTTLLSQVDSSVGGKTGVNHPLGKNMIGTFSQPSLVFIDIDTLRTLPEREFYSGMAEIIKYGVISDERLFATLKADREDILAHGESLVTIIKRSCEIKADVVSQDEREAGLRAILNFGHTIGHAIETVTGYKKYLHGEAISIGMAAAADIAVKMGIMQRQEAERIKELVRMYNLPCTVPGDLNPGDLIAAMAVDKKAKSGRLNFVLPESIGTVRIEKDIDKKLIKEVLENSHS
jgi:3-dehydroquinate synthase